MTVDMGGIRWPVRGEAREPSGASLSSAKVAETQIVPTSSRDRVSFVALDTDGQPILDGLEVATVKGTSADWHPAEVEGGRTYLRTQPAPSGSYLVQVRKGGVVVTAGRVVRS